MKTIRVEIPVTVKQRESGLYFVTSPLIKSLLVSDRDEVAALVKAVDAVRQLGLAVCDPEPVLS